MFEPAKLALDRAPVLRGVFDRLAGSCGDALRQICVPPCTFMLNSVTTGNTWDLVEGYEDGICGIYYSVDWDARIIIGLDRRFVFSLAEAMYGGDGTEASYESDRQFSSIECRAMKEMLDLIAKDLERLYHRP